MDDLGRAASSLSDSMWEIRELLDICEYLLVVQRLVAESGHIRWLEVSANQLDTVCTQLRRTEVVRAGHAERAGRLLDLPVGASLRDIAAAAPPPWDEILRDHVVAVRDLTASVAAARATTESSLAAGAAAVRSALEALDENPPAHASGAGPGEVTAARRLDRLA